MGYLDNTGLAYFWEKIKSNFFPGTKIIPGNSDLNDYTTPGVYYCQSTAVAETIDNMPVHLASSLMVLRTTGSGGCRQIFMPYEILETVENTNRIWTRAFYTYDGGWSDWYQIVTSMDRPVEYTTVGYESSAYSADKPWHKVAEFPYTTRRYDRRVIFTVTDSYMESTAAPHGRVDAKNGILRVHIRRNDDFNAEGKYFTKLTWILNTGYDTEDFVLIYVPDTDALELWTRVPNRWNYRTFNVIENGSRNGNNRFTRSMNPLITYGRVSNTGAQASYPTGDGYIVFKSVMADIQQAAKGIKDCGIKYDLVPARLGTANGFLAGDSVLKYFNSTSSITVANGAPTFTNGYNYRDSHVLLMPWDNAGGWDSMLAVPNSDTILTDGSMSTMQWRTGIGSNGVTTDENGNAIQSGYTDWFHLIDDRFTIDGVHVKKQHTTHYGVCSTAAATAVKTVDIPNFELVTGAYVIVKFTTTNSAAVANLKLNVSNTGDIPIKHRNGNFPAAGELIANRPFMFVYDGTNWQLAIDIDHNSNNYERVRTYYPIKAKSAITTEHVIVAGEDGLYFMLTSGNPFSIKYPPLYATANISANAKSTDAYYFGFLDAAVITNEAAETLVLNKALYIKGHLNGTTFTPFATKSLVCTEPTTEDGYQYLKLGVVKAAATSNDVLRAQIEMEHPIYEYVNGSFCLYEPKATDAEIDALFD